MGCWDIMRFRVQPVFIIPHKMLFFYPAFFGASISSGSFFVAEIPRIRLPGKVRSTEFP